MDTINKTIRYSKLLDIYQPLLTETQSEIMSDYFLYDLSLSEIAESRNVSRAAIEDALKKGMNKLDDFEQKMHLYEKQEKILNYLEEISNEENKEIIEKIERLVK